MNNGFIRFLIAAFLIIFGGILILENIGIATPNVNNVWFIVYPTMIILYGGKLVIDRMRFRGGSWVFGSFLIVFGGFLLLDRFDVIVFKFVDVFKLWPLLIIYLGFMIFRHSSTTTYKKYNKYEKKNKKFHKNSNFSIGSYEYNQQNWKVEPLYLTNLAGDFYFDFTKAFIPDDEIPITISALAGDVHILMPDHVEFKVDATVKAGEIDVIGQTAEGINRSLVYETRGYSDAVRKISFMLHLKAGSIRVDRIGGGNDV